MKVRHDFVTNSSSSSFIMAFKDKDDDHLWRMSYEKFKEECEWLDYEEFYELIDNFRKNPDHTNKQDALNELYDYYKWDYQYNLINKTIKREDYESTLDYFVARNEFANNPETKQKIQEYVENNEEYLKKKKQIEEADLVVSGMIWDTNGGVLEWAIRNDFIEQNFYGCHVITWHVG